MLLLHISDENAKLAAAFMQEYKDKGYGKNVLGVSNEEFYSFIYHGKLGELVFRDLLAKENIQFDCKGILIPHPGKFKREGSDFVLTATNETVDVKTAEGSYKTRLLVREDQFAAKRHDVYIGQRIAEETNVECWGYVTGGELSAIPPSERFGHGPCRHWPLTNVRSIEGFIRRAKKGEMISGQISVE